MPKSNLIPAEYEELRIDDECWTFINVVFTQRWGVFNAKSKAVMLSFYPRLGMALVHILNGKMVEVNVKLEMS